ncbi:MAG: hypothetical protein WA862_11485 [Solirubrobacterales bacterium]
MPVRSRVLLAVLAVATAILLLPAVSASGAGKNSTKIVISLKTPAFHGKLSSPRRACLGSRKVKMYREVNGTKKRLGKDTTADNGKWAILLGKNLKPGAYYAIVKARGKCKAAKSQILPIV